MATPPARKRPRTRLQDRTFVDPDTGEEQVLREKVPVRDSRPTGNRRGFTLMWLENLLSIPPMPWTAMRCLAALTKFHNVSTGTIRYRLEELQEITQDPFPQQTSRSIKTLIECKVIVRISRGEVMLNPRFAWIGDEVSQRAAQARLDEMFPEGY